MNFTTVDVAGGRTAARQAFLDYKHAVQVAHEQEAITYDAGKLALLRQQREADEAIMAGYRQIAMGNQVIDVKTTIASGGLDTHGRPKVIVARADLTRASVNLARDGALTIDHPERRGNARSAARIKLPARTFPGDASRGRNWDGLWATAVVPSIPPRLRPAKPESFWLLFEAEYLKPPVDPALLRPIGKGLAVVVATWDLTPVEAAVLGMTR